MWSIIARCNWSESARKAHNKQHPGSAVCEVPGCKNHADGPYIYPDDSETYLCEHHVTGLFCLGCWSFTGGTEDVFRFGKWECGGCVGWLDFEYGDDIEFADDDLPYNLPYDDHAYSEQQAVDEIHDIILDSMMRNFPEDSDPENIPWD